MPFQSVPETAEASVICTLNGKTVQNTYHGRKVGGYSTADLTALAAAIDSAVAVNWLPAWSTAVSYLRTEVRGLEFENDQVVTDQTAAGPGQVAVTPVPNNVSFAVRRLSGLTGRSARGRVYVFGIPSSWLSADENFLLAAQRLAYEAAVNAMAVAMTGIGWNPVIVSRFANGVPRSPAVTFPWISTSSFDGRVDTRRSRLPE